MSSDGYPVTINPHQLTDLHVELREYQKQVCSFSLLLSLIAYLCDHHRWFHGWQIVKMRQYPHASLFGKNGCYPMVLPIITGMQKAMAARCTIVDVIPIALSQLVFHTRLRLKGKGAFCVRRWVWARQWK